MTNKKVTKKKVSKKVTKKVSSKTKEKDFKDMTPLERAKANFNNYLTGAPTKYRIEFCEIVLEKMSEGYSKEAVAGFLGITERTLYNWQEKHEEFFQSLKEGERLSQIFWESKGIDYLTHTKNSKQLNSTSWIFNMKNRFGWTDKKEVNIGEDSKDVTINLAYNLEEDDNEGGEDA